MYRVKGQTYYGKYIGYLSDKYDEGLDTELLTVCYPVLCHAYSLDNETEISLGIMSYQRQGVDYFSENEKNCFDLLYCNWSNQPVEVFINGERFPQK